MEGVEVVQDAEQPGDIVGVTLVNDVEAEGP
jgi:hypothetical protein